LGTEQYNWLEQVLSTNKKWKFIFSHNAVGGNGIGYGNSVYGRGGGRAAYVGEQNQIHQMMIDNGVDAFFYGHDHAFFDMPVDGIHYTCTGASGNVGAFEPTTYNSIDESQSLLPVFVDQGYSIIKVRDSQVEVIFKNEFGNPLHSYIIYEKDGSDTSKPTISNVQVGEKESNDVEVTATITDDNLNMRGLMLYYRLEGEADYDYNLKLMTETSPNQFQAIIPAEFVTGNIEYFIRAEDVNRNSEYYPGPEPNNPLLFQKAKKVISKPKLLKQ
jgi:hypothetical protein